MQVEEVDGDNKEVDDPLEAETENNMIRSDKASVITIETGDIEVKNAVYCCGVDIGVFSKSTQLFLLSSGVMVFYLVYGYVQEWIFRLPGMKSHGWYLTLVQFACYSLMSKTQMTLQRENHRRIPLKTYIALALATLTTMGFSNSSLGYLNYPTQVIFKCCKLIPVLIGGILIQRKSYGFLDFSAAVLMSLGLIFFTLADSKISPNFHPGGVAFISIALLADAFLGNLQEKAMKQYQAGNAEVIFWSYSVGFAYLSAGLLAAGKLASGIEYFSRDPFSAYGDAVVFSISGFLGMQIVLTLVKQFGALITVTVTSFRKVVSVVISFAVFSKPFSVNYVYSGCLVLFGIYLNVMAKRHKGLSFRTLIIAFTQFLDAIFSRRTKITANIAQRV